jgi:hypothetical protein
VPKFTLNTAAQAATVCAAFALATPVLAAQAPSTSLPSQRHVHERLASLTVPFEENMGQFDRRVAFAARTFVGNLYVTRDGAMVHSLLGPSLTEKLDTTGRADRGAATRRAAGWTLIETPLRAQSLQPRGSAQTEAGVSRFTGTNASHWQQRIDTYQRVEMGEVWPGVTLSLSARGANVEKIFTLASNVEVERIAMQVEGATLSVAQDGALSAMTGNGPLTFTAPVAWQIVEGGEQVPVDVAYRLTGSSTYGFALGAFDAAYPVVIDPLVQATYLGGTGTDDARAMAVDASGNVLIAGYTQSPDFPGTSSGYHTGGGGVDAFVARLNPGLTTLMQATYFGGNLADVATSMRIDASGNVFVGGYTYSNDFPVTVGTAQTTKGGDTITTDGFIVRFNSALTSLDRGTYLGGTGIDAVNALALDGTNVIAGGHTNSATFPGTSGATQAVIGGLRDGFLARLTGDLALTRATYLGGSGEDSVLALTIATGNTTLYVAGCTSSTNFPAGTTSAGVFTSNAGGIDGFVARFTTSLLTRSRTTYLGGAGEDMALAIAADSAATPNIVVAGYTESTNFPAGTSGTGAQTANGGGIDAFVARFNDTLTSMFRSTYLGGGSTDVATAIMVHPSNDVYVTGYTASDNDPGPPFPGVKSAATCTSPCTIPGASSGIQSDSAGSMDAFVTRFNNTLSTHTQSTYLGGSTGDAAYAIVAASTPASPGNNVLIAGYTGSTNFRGTAGGAQSAYGGKGDAFVALMTLGLQTSGDQNPDTFKLVDQVNVPPGSTVTSAPVQITGITAAAPISVTGGQYCVSATNSCASCTFTTALGTINNNEYACVRHTAALGNGVITRTTLTVFGDASTFSSTTTPAVPDTDPTAFSFGSNENVAANAQIVSPPVQITGMNLPSAISISGAGNSQYCVSSVSDPVTPCPCDVAPYGSGAGSVSPNQFVCVRHDASPTPATTVTSTLTIGTVQGTLTSTTIAAGADTDPAPFPFASQNDVLQMVAVTSAPVQITGIDTPSPISVTGGQYCISSANDCSCNVRFFSAVASTIASGQHVCAKHTTPGTGGAVTNTTVTIGTVASTFSSTTGTTDTTPNAFSFGNQTGVPVSSTITSAPVQITGINTQVLAAISGAAGSTYCISSGNDCGCDIQQFTTTGAPVTNGRYVCVRHTSPASQSTQTSTTLDIGGVTATFTSTTVAPGATLTVSKSGAGTGTITSSAAGISCGGDCSETYAPGTVVTLTAVADGGSAFDVWTNCPNANRNVCTITVNSGVTVTASFAIPPLPARRADVSGEGRSDVLWYHTGVGGLIAMNANGLSLSPLYIVDHEPDLNWKIAGTGDLNGDGRADIVWHNNATGVVYALLQDGSTTLSEGIVHTEPNLDWKIEQVADLNGDNRADLVWKNQATGEVFVMLMNGLAVSSGQSVYTEPNLDWKIVASGDMNGDGRADILWRNVATGDVFAMLMNGFTVLSGGVIYNEPNLSWTIIGLADFNVDGRADVLWRNTATGDVFEMQMNGTAVSAGQVVYNEPSMNWKIVALGDYNGDGRADVLWRNTVTGHVYMMLMNGFAIAGADFVYTEPDTQWTIVGP